MGSSSDEMATANSDETPSIKSQGGGILARILRNLSKVKAPRLPDETQGTVAGDTRDMAQLGLSNLRRLRVDDVSIPLADISAVPIDIDKDALVEAFRSSGFSRLPVYKGTLDHPQGLVLLKDLALQHGFGAGGRFSLRKLLRPVLYAPPSMPAAVLLQKMQRDRVHMALVIDEYGGVDGLVTIEDLIETVIGEIEDEHDEAEGALWKQEKEGVFTAQSIAPLDEFEAAIGMALRSSEDDEDIDTLGGLVFVRVGRVPVRGEIIPHESGVEFEVMDADPRRIKRLRVRLPGYGANAAKPVAEAAPLANGAAG
jgi:magnesium and cobalt transporter